MTVKLLQSFNLIFGCYFTSRAPPRVPFWELTISLFLKALLSRWCSFSPGGVCCFPRAYSVDVIVIFTCFPCSSHIPSPLWDLPLVTRLAFPDQWSNLRCDELICLKMGLSHWWPRTWKKHLPEILPKNGETLSLVTFLCPKNLWNKLTQVILGLRFCWMCLPSLLAEHQKIAVQDADWRARFQVVFVNAMGRPEQGQDAGWSWRIH